MRNLKGDCSRRHTSSTLVDPALVSVVGVVNDQKKLKSPEKNVSDKGKKKSTPTKATKFSSHTKSSYEHKTTKSATDIKLEDLDKKWSERFFRLEAILLVRAMEKSPEKPAVKGTVQTVKVAPTNPP